MRILFFKCKYYNRENPETYDGSQDLMDTRAVRRVPMWQIGETLSFRGCEAIIRKTWLRTIVVDVYGKMSLHARTIIDKSRQL